MTYALASHLSVDELEVRYKRSKHSMLRQRWQTLWLRAQGMKSKDIQSVVGCSSTYITNWVKQYNAKGPDAVEVRPPKRHYGKLDNKQLSKVVKLIEHPPKNKPGWTGQSLLCEIERRFGVSYESNSIYPLLRRLGYRRLTPRPQHPKAEPQAQEAFKKELRLIGSQAR